jgi:hypothetical protein
MMFLTYPSRFPILLLICGLFICASSFGQKPAVVSDNRVQDLLFTEVNPLHGFGIFTFNTPFYIGNLRNTKSAEFSVGYSLGNTWHPQSTVYYPQNLTPQQRLEVNSLYVTDRPQYFEDQGILTKQKTFASDGVLQNLGFTYKAHFFRKSSAIIKLNTYTLSGGSSPMYYFASDRFIEKIHTWVGLDDNFGRKLFSFNQSKLFYEDENGKKIQIDKPKTFLGTLDLHFYQMLWQKEEPLSVLTLQGGTHFIIPLNNYYPKVAGGLSVSFFYRQQFSPRFYTDLAIDGSISNNSIASFEDAPNLIDRKLRMAAKSYMSINLVLKQNRTLTFGLICNYQDSFLKGNIYNDTQDNYRDLGIAYLKSGEVWDGAVISKTPRLSKLTAASMYYFSLKPYFFWGLKSKKSAIYFTICEDYPLVNNAPDIQYGIQFTRNLNW